MHPRTLAACGALLVLSACATTAPPDPLAGDYPALTPHDAVVGNHAGTSVRWGGRIIRTEPRQDRTCFEVVSTELDAEGRPRWTGDDTWGRFIGCREGFYDPALFRPNRDVTFTGRIDGYEERKLQGQIYDFPRVDADVVHLWPDPVPAPRKRSAWPWAWNW